MFAVTKLHTTGILAGISTTELTSVPFVEGEVVDRAIGGGSYRITRVRPAALCFHCGTAPIVPGDLYCPKCAVGRVA